MNYLDRLGDYIDWPRFRQSFDTRLSKLASLALAVLVLGHILGVATWDFVEHIIPASLRVLFGLVSFGTACAWLRVHRFSRKGALGAFTAPLVGGHWVALDLHHWLQ